MVCSSLCFNGATNTKTLYLLIIVIVFQLKQSNNLIQKVNEFKETVNIICLKVNGNQDSSNEVKRNICR